MKIYNNVIDLIGNTPIVKINNMGGNATLLAKLEAQNPGGSIKDRAALNMLKKANLPFGSTIIEPTSGNTGIALAYLATLMGYKLILTMPATMSVERRKLLTQLGAQLELTPGEQGMKGAILRAQQLQQQLPGSVILGQFSNYANVEAHQKTTAQEILQDTDSKIDALVLGVGTGGTITGVASVLKQKIPHVKVFAVEPHDSAILSGECPGQHKIQGIGAGFVPEILQQELIDEVIKIRNEQAIVTAKLLAQKEGILVGISSGAAMAAVLEIATRKEFYHKTILTIFPDSGERYLSTELFDS